MNLMLKMGSLLALFLVLSSCFKTRTEVYDADQNYVTSKKQADNEMAAAAAARSQEVKTQLDSTMPAQLDDRDETIRALNGRLEALETQFATMAKSQDGSTSQDSQKLILLQEALTKLEEQVQKLEENSAQNSFKANLESSDNETISQTKKKLNTYETAQMHFSEQDWMKAILNFQKYIDEFPKGKNVPDSTYKIGVCFEELGKKEEAMAFFEEVVANYGKTDLGKKSKLRLAKLKKNRE